MISLFSFLPRFTEQKQERGGHTNTPWSIYWHRRYARKTLLNNFPVKLLCNKTEPSNFNVKSHNSNFSRCLPATLWRLYKLSKSTHIRNESLHRYLWKATFHCCCRFSFQRLIFFSIYVFFVVVDAYEMICFSVFSSGVLNSGDL